MPADLSTYWKDDPDQTTPLSAAFLNGWGAALKAVADAAAASALAAAAPTDAVMASKVNTVGSATDVALKAIYAVVGSGGAPTDANVAPIITQPLTKAALGGAYASLASIAAMRGRIIARSKVVADTAGVTAEVVIPGSTITFDADGTTEYQLGFVGKLTGSVIDSRIGVKIRRGTTTAGTIVGEFVYLVGGVVGTGQSFSGDTFDTPPAGSVSYVLTLLLLGGTGTVTSNAAATSPTILTAFNA